ncbi:MAG: hypothetical protein EPN23_08550 [Verrucomicrobia bacterium]|nr:MAG: hypothetical protein EPN23_08550 [Verrucomicrobiota bacterium]
MVKMKVTGLLFVVGLGLVTLSVLAEDCVYPPGVKGILDVTKAPYFADNTGQRDCTAALIRAFDDALREDHQHMQEARALTKGIPKQSVYHDAKRGIYTATELSFEERQRILKANPKALIGIERPKGVFPAQQAPAKILYFPNGTYLVSDTVTYSFTDLKVKFTEENRCIHFMGQSQQGTIIRLKDHAPGFSATTNKAVINFTHGEWSNVAMQNTFENFTIEIGAGNPGADGLEFFANNSGAIRNVTIRSLDKEKAGHAGLSLSVYNFSCVLAKNIEVDGFDYGVRVTQARLYAVLEHVRVRNQRVTGFYLEDNNVALRGLVSSNKVPAVRVKGKSATLALLDGDFAGGPSESAAVECEGGFLFARDLKTSGYQVAVQHSGKTAVQGPNVAEYVSHSVFALFPNQKKESLRLPIEETPEIS